MISRSRKKPSRRVRSGSLLLEVVAGLAALGIALVLISRATIAIDRQWQLTHQERLVIETLDNAMEAASSLDWSEITNERLTELPIPNHAQHTLHKVALSAKVLEETLPAPSKRLRLTLTWHPMPDAKPLSRSLTAWVHSSVEEKP